jgi:anti-anti-sigma factor
MTPLLRITTTDQGIRLEGELDLSGASEFRRALEEAARSDALTIDASGLSFMDSSGLKALVDVAASRNGGPPIVLLRPTRPIMRLLEIGVPGGVHGLEVRE